MRYLHIYYKTSLFIIFFFSFQSTIYSQEDFIKVRPEVKINYIENDPIIDGNVINDKIWNSIFPITSMTQVTPNFGEPSSEKTEIRLAYTDRNLYISVVGFDSDPSKIVVSDSKRDADLNDEDSFLFILDTYNDFQNGFLFGTNSDGMQYDAQIDNEGIGNFNPNSRQKGGTLGGTNVNWDASWEVKTIKGDFGWSAEFSIPLSSLRFLPGENKTWGLNFQRNISKNSETSFWASLPLGFDIKRVSISGKLKGLDLKSPKNLKIIPYTIGNASYQKLDNQTDVSVDLDAGFDIKYSLTPGLTLDLTYNTDFAQVEVDEQQVNLDRFNLFFPEKRAFFLENAGQFSVGSPGEVDLFFSRRIGIGDEGQVVPIKGGGRISGKIGQTNVGILNMVTDEISDQNIYENNFSVARVNHDFNNSRSSLGVVYVGKNEMGDSNKHYNNVYAIDGKLGLGKKADITGFFSKSDSPGIDSSDHSFKLIANYNWDGWRINAGYTEVGEGFNPEVGFLMRSAFKKPEFIVFKQIRLKDFGPLLEVRPHIAHRSYFDFQDRLVSSWTHIDNHWVWPSGFEIHTGVNITSEGVFDAFKISDVEIPSGEYYHNELQLYIKSNPNTALSFTSRTVIGGYYGGDRFLFSNNIKYRIGNKFNSTLNLDYTKLNLENGDINALISGLRLSYSFSPKMYLQSLIQYNNVTNVTSVNTRFGMLQTANSGLFIVINFIKDSDWFDYIDNRSISVKYSYQFDAL
ncbi:carbohydrate binding family 9 domain-containing protein [Flavobacteriaceae bacterium]|nr:carbohydrate binding family 9 domain-containing protein [Flavobacteriaceae bacterium]